MFEAYSVAVRVSLINGVAGGLMAMSRQFGKVHGDATRLQHQLDKIGRTMLVGGALTGVGMGIFGMIGATLPAAKEYAHQLAQMNVAGMTHLEIARATAAAWNSAKGIPTSTATQNLEAIRELRTVVGSTTEALNVLPTVLRLQAVLSNVKGVSDSKGTAFEVAKLLDIRGASMDSRRFQTEANMMLQAIVASGGTLGPKDFFSTGKYGRLATQGWSPEFMYQILPTLMQEMKSGNGGGGSGGPGNALMSAYAAVVGGTISQKSLKLWDQIGLLDPSKVVWNKVGSAKGVLPGGIKGTELFQSNPFQWTQQVLMPALRGAGINDPKQQQQYLQMLFSNRTAGFAMSQMALQPLKFTRDQGIIRGASGLAAYDTLLKTDPIMAQQALHASLNNLMTQFGIEILPDLINALRAAVPLLQQFTHWMQQHPNSVKGFLRTLAVLGAFFIVAGGITLTAGSIQAFALLFRVLRVGVGVSKSLPLLATGITSVTTALTGMGAVGLVSLGAGLAAVAVGLGTIALWVRYHKDVWAGMADAGGQTPGGLADSGRLGPTSSARGVFAQKNPWHIGSDTRLDDPRWVGARPAMVPPHGLQKQSFTGDVHIDGHKVGKVVWRHQNTALDRHSRASGGRVDPGMSLAPVGLGHAV